MGYEFYVRRGVIYKRSNHHPPQDDSTAYVFASSVLRPISRVSCYDSTKRCEKKWRQTKLPTQNFGFVPVRCASSSKWMYSSWKRDHVPGAEPWSLSIRLSPLLLRFLPCTANYRTGLNQVHLSTRSSLLTSVRMEAMSRKPGRQKIRTPRWGGRCVEKKRRKKQQR